MHDVFALCPKQVVREASRRVLGLRPFDVQLIGGMILHEGKIAEMATGEGKTLVAVLPAFLNALSGKVRVSRICPLPLFGMSRKCAILQDEHLVFPRGWALQLSTCSLADAPWRPCDLLNFIAELCFPHSIV